MIDQTKLLFIAVPVTLFMTGVGSAHAATALKEAGAIVCTNDKWDEKEVEKGHKLVDYAGRCADIPDDPAGEKFVEDCTGKYEYLPDGSWTGTGTCTLNLKGGHVTSRFEEGSQLREFSYRYTGGTDKFKGVSGGGTYTNDMLSDTLTGGRYHGTMELP